MALSWNEIKTRAITFSKEYEHEVNEHAEAKSFWDKFFEVFGISRRRVATFEEHVKKIEGQGFIDLLWKGVILVEHKSRGKDLDKAYEQAVEYFPGLKEHEIPKYILVSDFERFRLYDLEEHKQTEFLLKDFVNHVHLFGFIAGYEKKAYKDHAVVNVHAAEMMGKLHDALKEDGYKGHALEIYLVRLLFCLFADDSSIFEKGIFHEYLDLKTKEDGSDLAMHIDSLFSILNTPENQRLKHLDEHVAAFPYVNGKLFSERLPVAAFDAKMRTMLLNCCALDWSQISPAIFGSMFQSVMDEKARRNLGAHYTSEKNILKLIKPLFLDELWIEFESSKNDKRKLKSLHDKIRRLKLLDPACGCGNFLILAYREIRLLEISIVKELLKGQQVFDIGDYFLVNVDQFYGIEIEEFPAQVAQVAMWLSDHQMNMKASELFGQYYKRLPLIKSATIIHADSLQVEWERLLPEGEQFSFIVSNPPFSGKSLQDQQQKAGMEKVFSGVKGGGVLDFVAAWYMKAAQYVNNYTLSGNKTKVGYVSTNSICQGEQTSVLWNELFNKFNIKIHFAHRTFKWGNEARGQAAVHVVIIGFSNYDITNKQLFEYDDIKAEPHVRYVKNINSYLVEGKDLVVANRSKPLCNVPEMMYGNKIVDGGFYLFTDEEKDVFIEHEPAAFKYFKPILSGEEFLNGRNRWILYLKDTNPSELKNMPKVLERVNAVKTYRLNSSKVQTRELSNFPLLFAEPRQPLSDFLLIPRTSSENRKYIPLGFFTKDFIVNDSCIALPNADNYYFGILSSMMHMTWVKYVAGRLKSDFRYSSSIIYNNFPFPINISDVQRGNISNAAQAVLNVRKSFPDSSLADLYNPILMPPALVKGHQNLDKVVDLAYRPQPFINEAKRIEFLFELFEHYTATLFTPVKKIKKKSINARL